MAKSQTEHISFFCRCLGLYFLCLILGSLRLGQIGSLLRQIAILPILVWVFQSHKVRVNQITLSGVMFVGWCVISYVWTITPAATVTRMASQVMYLVLLFACSGYSYSKNEIDFLEQCLVWSSRITAVIMLASGNYVEGRLCLSGLIQEDPNYLCGYMFYAVAYCTSLLNLRDLKFSRKLLAVLELFVYAYVLYSTGSRGGLLSTVMVAGACILLVGDKTLKSMVNRIIIVVVMLVVASMVSSFLPSEIANRFSTEAIMTSNGTGRFEIWEDALNAYSNYPVFRQIVGYGGASFYEITFRYPFRIHNVAHNIFIENLCEAGLVGLVIYLYHLGSYIFVALRTKKPIVLGTLTGLIALSMSTSLQVFKPYWNIMFFTLVFSIYAKQQKDGGGGV